MGVHIVASKPEVNIATAMTSFDQCCCPVDTMFKGLGFPHLKKKKRKRKKVETNVNCFGGLNEEIIFSIEKRIAGRLTSSKILSYKMFGTVSFEMQTKPK